MLFEKIKYQFLLFTLIFSILSNFLFGQHQDHKKALYFQELSVIHFRQGDTTTAFEFALEAIKRDSLFANPWVMLGNIYEQKQQHFEAIHAYARALELDPDEFPDLFYVVSELEFKQKDFINARMHVEKYLSLDRAKGKKKVLAIELLQKINFRALAYAQPVKYLPENLGEMINSVHDEYVNSLSTDEKSMYITVKKNLGTDIHGRISYAENICQIDFDDSTWSTPHLLSIDGEFGYASGGASVSPNNRYLFFTSCNQKGGQGSCDLYYALIREGELSSPKNLGSVVNSGSWDSQPSFSSDGKSLFFASKRPGGYGGSDIWISELDENGRFQKPFNAGDKINTKGDEMAPLIHYDAKTLYFSSNGHIGMGGFDLFISKRELNGNWQYPINLGYPLNTEGDEINLIVAPDGTSAYISSDKDMGYGGFDIYRFVLNEDVRPNTVSYVKGIVFDLETGEKLNAEVELNLLEMGEQFTRTESDLDEGSFLVALPSDELIGLNVSKTGYLFYSEHFNTRETGTKSKPVELKIPLKKIKLGNVEVLNNIFFETDSFSLKETSYPELEKLVDFLQKNPSLRIEISGHTDDVGSSAYNQELSERRAESVINFLIKNGINSNRLQVKGYGMDFPVESNENPEGRAKNRRTELKVLNLD